MLKKYKYKKRDSVLTKSEVLFYGMLHEAVGKGFVIIPQAHLSSFLNEKKDYQNWRAAFSRINGKSVDFLLCSKETLRPLIAIELDDYTHEFIRRKERDSFVEEVLENADIWLVRFKKGEWDSPEAIMAKLYK